MIPRRAMPWAIVLLLIAGCGERIVYRDRDLLEGIPAGAANYVGYTNVEARLTVCGNCHVTQQNQWQQTAHATAFTAAANLAPAQAEVCAQCHAVSHLGNEPQTPGGWMATRDARYRDVQCESCHGPGLEHVRNPDGGTAVQMRARINAGLNMNGTCAECHSGFHHPFVANEWAASRHGQVIASPAGNPSCAGCHEGKAALAAFGVQSDYVERDQPGHIAITCAVCHDPHRGTHGGQLRFSISVPDEQRNLCMRCHQKRGGPEFTAQNRGPHSPEGPMLLGEAGWWPPNMPLQPGSRIVTTHGSEANPRMCAGCHMHQFQATDRASGTLAMPTTSHRFDAIPCLNERGEPVFGTCGIQQRTFRTCTGAGCHGTEAAARNAMTVVRLRLDNWNNQLKSQLARVPAAEFNPNDNRYSTGEGARFNSQLADRSGSAVHNPFLMEALLIGSIQQVQRDYGISPASPAEELDMYLRRAIQLAEKTALQAEEQQ